MRSRFLFSFLVFTICTLAAWSQEDAGTTIEVISGGPLNIVRPGYEDALKILLKNNGDTYQSGWLSLSVTAYSGQEVALEKRMNINPGSSVEVDFPDQIFDQRGVHWVDYQFVTAAKDTLSGRSSFAYMEPIGNDYPQDKSSFKFGIAGIRFYNPESFELQLKAAQLMGAAYERKYASWGQIQPKQGEWNWEQLDREIAAAEEYGIERQLLINGGTQWAVREKYEDYRKKNNTPPRIKPWEEYIHQLATRYQDRITYYEIWNEPDIGFYHGTIDEYLELLKSAYRTIKKVDPDLQVMSGGFASAIPRSRYLEERGDLHREVVRKGQKYFDVHAFHRHSPFSRFRNEVEGPLQEIRSLLKKDKPLWFNETAMHSTFIGEKEQARVLFKKLTYGWARGAMGYTWFNMLSNPNYAPSHHEHNYGMLTKDFNPKAVYVAYNELVTQLHNKQFIQQLETPQGYYAFLFGNDQEKVIVTWKEDESEPDLMYLPSFEGISQVEMIDLMGNLQQCDSYQDRFPLVINKSCKFYKIKTGGDLGWEQLAIKPLVESGIDGFELTVNTESQVQMQTNLLYPAADAQPGEQSYAIRSADLPSFFKAKLSYQAPEAGWYGLLEVPVRLLTPLTTERWRGRAPDFSLDQAGQVTNRFEHDPASTHLTWKGPQDVSAEGWFQYQDQQLKINLVVEDDQFVSSDENSRGDYVRIMLYPKALEQKITYRLELTPNNQVELDYSGPEAYNKNLDLEFSRSDKLFYQIGIPFSKEILEAGIGYNLQVHDNDGEEVEGYIQLTPGMGVVDEPHYFPVLKLEE